METIIQCTAQVTQTAEGTLIEKGPDIFIPADDPGMFEIDQADRDRNKRQAGGERECDQCGTWFTSRMRSGGKPQKFCKPDCRAAFHAENDPNVANVGQRGEAKSTALVPVPPEPEKDEPEAEFHWGSDDSVLLHAQPATAIYTNKFNQVVIRQEAAWNYDEDSFVFIDGKNLKRVIDALIEIDREVGGGK